MVLEWCYAIGKTCHAFQQEVIRSKTAECLDEALSLLWTLVDEAGPRSTLGLFLWMAEWIRAQSPRGGAYHESCSPP